MLFSVPLSGWRLIAVAATAFFLIGAVLLSVGVKVPDELRDTLEQEMRQGRRLGFTLTLALAVCVLAMSLLRPETAPHALFLYSVAITAIPTALFPVRGRMLRDHVARQRNPGTEIKPDRLTMIWVGGFISVVLLVAVIALMAASYDT